jgi:hypothetical protein
MRFLIVAPTHLNKLLICETLQTNGTVLYQFDFTGNKLIKIDQLLLSLTLFMLNRQLVRFKAL